MRSTGFIELHGEHTGALIYLAPARIVFIEERSNSSGSLLVLDGGIRIVVCEAPFEIQALIDAAAAINGGLWPQARYPDEIERAEAEKLTAELLQIFRNFA